MRKQAGMTVWTLIVVIGVVGIFFVVGMKSVPVYLNQMKVHSVITRVAENPEHARATPQQIRVALSRFWDIENIDYLQPRDVRVQRVERGGRMLAYDYEARVSLFRNIDLVFTFADEVVIPDAP
jgi:Tfp pilus assembly protein PilE